MKTYHQFSEDIEQRRKELRRRQKEQMQNSKDRQKRYNDDIGRNRTPSRMESYDLLKFRILVVDANFQTVTRGH